MRVFRLGAALIKRTPERSRVMDVRILIPGESDPDQAALRCIAESVLATGGQVRLVRNIAHWRLETEIASVPRKS
jgi:hypothetical protein